MRISRWLAEPVTDDRTHVGMPCHHPKPSRCCRVNLMMQALVASICLFTLLGCDRKGPVRPPDTRSAEMQDLAELRRYVTLDRSYSAVQRQLAMQAIRESEEGAGEWTQAEFELQVARVVALADNGHSRVWSRSRSNRMNRLPVRLFLFEDGVYVIMAKVSGVPVLGKRVVAIDGFPIGDALRKLRIYRGGRDNLRDYDDLSLLESPELLHAAGIAQSDQEVTLTVSGENHISNVRLSAWSHVSEPDTQRLRLLAAQPINGQDAGWRDAFQSTPMPLWLQQPDVAFRFVQMPPLRAVYLQLKTNTNADDGEEIVPFLAQARQSITKIRPQNIILDMRFNGGGDYTKTAAFMSELPTMVPGNGRIFVITDVATFSAAISSIGFAKQAAPQKVILVGEPSGDRLIFYGEPRKLTLPNSKIELSYSTGLHDYLHGCHWFGHCYLMDWFYPISVPTLEPAISAPLSFALANAGNDPAMDAITRTLEGLNHHN